MSLANRTIDLASKQVLVAADGTAAAPSITNDGDTNTGMFFPAADTIAFSEGGTESMRIDSSGNVGIGNASPSSYNASGDNLVVGNTGDNGITIVSGTDGKGYLFFADGVSGTNAYAGQVDFDHSVNALKIGVLGTERLRIDSSGNLLVGTTSASVGATGRGLLEVNGSTDSLIALKRGGTAGLYLYTSSAEGRLGQSENLPLTLYTNNTERLRITSGGSIFHTGTNNEEAWVQIGNGNANGYYPATGGLGCAIAWNFTVGGRENTFMNCDTSGQGFRWLQRTGTSSNSYVGSAGSNGVWYQGNNSSAWSTVSDSRIKTNIREINDAVGKIMALHPCHFEYIDKQGKTKTGFIAQEFENVFSGHIVEESYIPDQYKEYIPEGEKIKGIDLDLIPYLAKAIQELKAENDSLKTRITALEAA